MDDKTIRELLLKRALPFARRPSETGLRAWCRAHDVTVSHASEFLNGRRRYPGSDLLKALGLESRIVRVRRRLT